MEIAVLAAIGVVLLIGLVALAVGNRGWSIGTVVAAILVLHSAGGYLYLAARLAAREAAWAGSVADLETRLAQVRDGQRPGAGGRLEPLPNVKSLAELRRERDRWARVAATVDTWRDRYWTDVSFETVPGDAGRINARIVVPRPQRPAGAREGGAAPAADAAAPQPAAPPLLTPGASIFVFDDQPLAEGGRYLGAFIIQEATFDAGIDSQVINATLIGEPTARDRRLLAEPHGSVTLYDQLPVDRWIAFYRTQPPADSAAAHAIRPRDDLAAEFEGLDDEQVQGLVRGFLERCEKHDCDVPEPQWAAALARLADGSALPGTLWATVSFEKAHSFAGGSGSTPREFTTGEQAEFDLATAFELRQSGIVKIERVRERRPLADASAAIYGALVLPAEAGSARPVLADGALALTRQLQAATLASENAGKRLTDALEVTQADTAIMEDIAKQLRDDLASWERDVTAATGLADTFAASEERTRLARRAADEAIVALGQELTAALGRLAAEIDRVAPAPAR